MGSLGAKESRPGLSRNEKSRAGPAVGGAGVGLVSISERARAPTISCLLITSLNIACVLTFQGKNSWQGNAQNWAPFPTPPCRPSRVLPGPHVLPWLHVHTMPSSFCFLLGFCLETGPFGGSMSLATTARPQPRSTSSLLLVKLVQVGSPKPPCPSVLGFGECFRQSTAQPGQPNQRPSLSVTDPENKKTPGRLS